jgi:cytosine/adenosine deaminase-related metal-dependent hydrolase
MKNRKLTADWLFDGNTLQQHKVLVLNEENRVLDIIDAASIEDGVEYFEGILTPGFINCHCHLELSHLKNSIAPEKGLVDFLLSVIRLRKEKDDVQRKAAAIKEAEREMYQNGIVAVADIANTGDTIPVKKGSLIQWHTLVEVLNLWDNNLEQALPKFQGVQQQYATEGLAAVITAHAPYSVSEATFRAINTATAGAVISVHNQETAAENELFQQGTGKFLDFYQYLNNTGNPFPVLGQSSLQSWLPYFTNGQTILLIHNTFIEEADILFAKEHAAQYGLRIIYCLCPNANNYIESQLPPIDLLIKHQCHIVLGTDSYSSNWQLSIAKEMETIHKHYPAIPMEALLQWGTRNGAAGVGWEGIGAFIKGAQPGVVLLKPDFSVQRLA